MGVMSKSGWLGKNWRMVVNGVECYRVRPQKTSKRSIFMPTFALAQPQKNQCSRTPELFYGRHYLQIFSKRHRSEEFSEIPHVGHGKSKLRL
jgi:hypothetical protein